MVSIPRFKLRIPIFKHEATEITTLDGAQYIIESGGDYRNK